MELRLKTRPTRSISNAPAGMDEQIQHLAYRLWEQRGRQSGHELEDWLQAERELAKIRVRATTASQG